MEKQAGRGLSFPVVFFCVDMARKFSEREKYYIPVEGQLIEVTREVYMAFYQAERRERYIKEQEHRQGVLYVGKIEPNTLEQCSYLQAKEDTEAQAIDNVYREYLMDGLEDEEQRVFCLCCFEGHSIREASQRMGVHYLKVNRILKRVRKKLQSKMQQGL